MNLNNSAAGHDEIPAEIIKPVASSINEPLTHVLSVSLNTGVVPKKLKAAEVIPLFKEGDPSLFTNHWPVSLLPWLSKVLENVCP